jgi:hypothetical protein
MNKIKPHTFHCEHKKYEDEKTWLLGMMNYFQLHNYSSQAEGIIYIYHLNEKKKHQCGRTNLYKYNTLMRINSLGGSSRSTFRRNT